MVIALCVLIADDRRRDLRIADWPRVEARSHSSAANPR
jgi:hypothetical protein